MAKNAVITGWGFYAPSRVMTNAELERIVDTSDEWIASRTGIRERRIASDGETTSSMSTRAARIAIDRARLRPQDVQMIIVGTCSPDYVFPATACMVQNALVIGAETLSRFLNWKDRTTCVLFGDGAGAVVLEASNASVGIESVILHSDGSQAEKLMIPAGGARIPATQGTLDRGQHLITMQGGDVFKLAVKSMADAAEEALAEAGLGLDDIALMIPHQANIRIIEQVAKRLHFPMDRVFVNIQRYGNTSAASIPIAICEAEATGRLRRGDKVLLVAFGGGFTWGASVLEWFGAHDGVRPPGALERAREAIEDVVE